MNSRIVQFCCLMLLSTRCVLLAVDSSVSNAVPNAIFSNKKSSRLARRKPDFGPRMAKFWGEYFQDVLYVHQKMFSWDTFKIIATTFPFFVGLRMADERVHEYFYNKWNHENKTRVPKIVHDITDHAVAVPIVFFALQGFLSRDEELSRTGRVFVAGMPFVIFANQGIKKLEFEACLRPWNEDFSCEKRVSGGFPSGHLAEITYMATLYGLRYGVSHAVPLGALGVFTAGVFLACNRHYISQLVAGIGLGAIYGVAAHRVVDMRLDQNLQLAMGVTPSGGPSFSMAFRF